MLKIAIGTNSKYKVNAIKKALYELDFDFSTVNGNADSGISDQPNKRGETKRGSINRAQDILSKFSESDIGIGVEFGYEPIKNTFHMVCWSTIATKDGKVFSEQSSTLELPALLVEALNNNIDINSSLDKVLGRLENNERNRLFKQYIYKRRVIYESASNVTLRYLLDKEVYS